MPKLGKVLVIAVATLALLGCEDLLNTDYSKDVVGTYIVTSITIPVWGTFDMTELGDYEAMFLEFKEDEVISFSNDETICESTYLEEVDGISKYTEDRIEFDDDTYVEYDVDGDVLTIEDVDGTIVMELYEGDVPPASWSDPSLLPNDSFEPDDSFAEANTIAVGTTNEAHFFGACDDQDYFMFTAAAGATYLIESSTTDADIDPELELYNSSQTMIDYDSDSGVDWNFSLTWTCQTTGTYYFMVESWLNFDVGDYTVSLTQAPTLAKQRERVIEEKPERVSKPDFRAILFN